MRPDEICSMTVGDLKRTKKEFAEYGQLYDGENWLYVLPEHKTKKHIGTKILPIGIQEQNILTKYLTDNPQDALFKNYYGKPLTEPVYSRNVKQAIDRNGLQKFVPYQIRQTSLTEISLEHGRDIARAVAGHLNETITARYDHSDYRKALLVVNERNRTYKERKVVGDLTGRDIPNLRIFTGE
jgi:integrase